MHQRYIAVENIVRKGEIACYKQFLFFSQCFLPNMALIFQFKCTLKCRLQFVSIWTSLKFVHLVMGYIDEKQSLVTSDMQQLLVQYCFSFDMFVLCPIVESVLIVKKKKMIF